MTSKFTEDARGLIIGAIRAGRPLEHALDGTGVARSTFHSWMRRGGWDSERAAASDYARFRQDVEDARALREEEGLSQRDLISLLETAARRSSVQAMKLLLERPWEQQPSGREKPASPFDELEEGDELARRRGKKT